MLNEEIHRPLLRCQPLQGVGAGMRIASFCFSSAFLMLCSPVYCLLRNGIQQFRESGFEVKDGIICSGVLGLILSRF
jgi:hypothetical protein